MIGALAYFVFGFLMNFVSGPLLHEGVLDGPYREVEQFWRPELMSEPMDMGDLLLFFFMAQIFNALVFAGLFVCYRSALDGPAWKKGMVFGFSLAFFIAGLYLGMNFVFNMPSTIWFWWAVSGFVYLTLGGAVVGWATGKWAPEA